MSLEGDFSKLEDLTRKLKGVELLQVAGVVVPMLKDQLLDLYQKSFATQQGPIGGPWSDSPNKMVLTGELSNPEIDHSAGSSPSVRLVAPAHYARFHQGGWKTGGERMRIAVATDIRTRKEIKRSARVGGKQAGPARPVLPSKTTAGEWDEPLRETINSGVREYFEQ